MDTSTLLILGVLYGSFGMGYVVYGKKQKKGVALLSGIALCVFPYFIQNVYVFNLIGIILIVLPFLIKM